jgi:chemotaxis protein CheC
VLNLDQLDDFKEIGNIGAGKAAARLSDLIHRRCTINFPEITHLDVAGIKRVFTDSDSFSVALYIKIMGDIPAIMFVIMKRTHVQAIIQYMTKISEPSPGKDLTFTAQFGLKQLGEILTKSFSDSISQFLMTKAKYAMPEIVIDTWSTALDSILTKIHQPEQMQLVIHSGFFDMEKSFEGKFIYVLSPDAQESILNRIKLLVQGAAGK